MEEAVGNAPRSGKLHLNWPLGGPPSQACADRGIIIEGPYPALLSDTWFLLVDCPGPKPITCTFIQSPYPTAPSTPGMKAGKPLLVGAWQTTADAHGRALSGPWWFWTAWKGNRDFRFSARFREMALVDSLITTRTPLPTLALPAFSCNPTPKSWQALFPAALQIGKACSKAGPVSYLSVPSANEAPSPDSGGLSVSPH